MSKTGRARRTRDERIADRLRRIIRGNGVFRVLNPKQQANEDRPSPKSAHEH